MKAAVAALALLLTACASAPQPYCIPPDLTRAPEADGGVSPVPRANSIAAEQEYERCKEDEADRKLEAKLRADEVVAKKREAEKLEQELKEMEEQKQKQGK